MSPVRQTVILVYRDAASVTALINATISVLELHHERYDHSHLMMQNVTRNRIATRTQIDDKEAERGSIKRRKPTPTFPPFAPRGLGANQNSGDKKNHQIQAKIVTWQKFHKPPSSTNPIFLKQNHFKKGPISLY